LTFAIWLLSGTDNHKAVSDVGEGLRKNVQGLKDGMTKGSHEQNQDNVFRNSQPSQTKAAFINPALSPISAPKTPTAGRKTRATGAPKTRQPTNSKTAALIAPHNWSEDNPS
jgi:hypothetical protein